MRVMKNDLRSIVGLFAAAILFFSLSWLPAKDWAEYTGCRLTPGAYHDGDSFSQVSGLKVEVAR